MQKCAIDSTTTLKQGNFSKFNGGYITNGLYEAEIFRVHFCCRKDHFSQISAKFEMVTMGGLDDLKWNEPPINDSHNNIWLSQVDNCQFQ